MVRWMKLAASSGFYAGDRTRRAASSGCPWALAFRMSGMKAPAIMQAMPSSRLLMLTVISFPDPALLQEVEAAPDASETILRFFLLRGSRLGFGAA